MLLDPRNRVLSLPRAIPGRMHAAYGRSTPSELGDRSFSIFLELSASDFIRLRLFKLYFFFKKSTFSSKNHDFCIFSSSGGLRTFSEGSKSVWKPQKSNLLGF